MSVTGFLMTGIPCDTRKSSNYFNPENPLIAISPGSLSAIYWGGYTPEKVSLWEGCASEQGAA
jgi:hypothetical protein